MQREELMRKLTPGYDSYKTSCSRPKPKEMPTTAGNPFRANDIGKAEDEWERMFRQTYGKPIDEVMAFRQEKQQPMSKNEKIALSYMQRNGQPKNARPNPDDLRRAFVPKSSPK